MRIVSAGNNRRDQQLKHLFSELSIDIEIMQGPVTVDGRRVYPLTRHTGEFQLQPPEIEFPSILRSKRNTHPGSNLLKPTEKIYLDNSNIYKAMSDELGFNDNTGTVREIFFIKMLQNANENIYYSRTGDFQVNDTIFEIGEKK